MLKYKKPICTEHTAHAGERELNILNEASPSPPAPLRRDSDSSSVSFSVLSPPLFCFLFSLLGSGRLLFHKLGTVGHKQIDTYFWNRGDVYGAPAAQITQLRYLRCPALASGAEGRLGAAPQLFLVTGRWAAARRG